MSNDSDDDSITEALEQVGMLPSFSIPTLPSLPSLAKDYHNTKFAEKLSENAKYLTSQKFEFSRSNFEEMINNKRQEFTQIYMGLSESLKEVINSNIDYPVEGLFQETDSKSIEPQVLPQEEIAPKMIEERLANYDHLTYLTFEQFSDQYFLRNRIKEILQLNITPLDQRFLIQKLMSRSYLEKQKYEKEDDGSDEDASSSDDESLAGEVENENEDEDEVVLTADDKEPTYYNLEENILGCQHYQRNCKIECSFCKKWYTCRLCHDQEISSHQLQRAKTTHILCMFCSTPQFPQQYCINCDKKLSEYYCDKCKLFDNDPLKNIYHCDSCGICRLGLGLNQDYFHCDNCNACISIELRSNHKCIENSTHSNCPICDEYMFHSTKTVVFMLCGHPIHQSCFDEFSKHSYKCPVCSRTVMNMELQFRVLDKEIKESKMPDGMADWKTVIKCVDCGGKSKVPYHYLGMRCDHCKSYNTMQLKLIKANGAQSSINYEKSSGEVGFIENSLDDNFQFDGHVEGHDEPDAGLKLRGNDYDSEDEADYADNFIRVINNFDKYSSIGDAFKDWLNTSKRKSDDDNIVNEGEGDD